MSFIASSTCNTDIKIWSDERIVLGLQNDCRVTHIALAERHSVHRHLADAVEMNQRRHNYQNVEDLMRLSLKN